MGDWPSDAYGFAARSTGNPRVNKQTGGSGNTKTTYQEVIASTPFDGYALVTFHMADSSDFLFDLAIGAEGAEVVILSNLIGSCPGTALYETSPDLLIPILIPAGTRISYRLQSYGASLWSNCAVSIVRAGNFSGVKSCQFITTYGAATADSGGTSIDPGGSALTKGAYVQITAATTARTKGLILGIGGQRNTTRTTCYWYLDVAIGDGDEVIISDYYIACRSEGDLVAPVRSCIIPVDIPAGTEISVRASCSITDATDRLLDVVLYALT